MKEDIKQKLEFYPVFRERQHKDICISKLLIKKYNLTIPAETLKSICKDFEDMNRYWRDILKHTPRLQGSDYKDKGDLEFAKKTELGYQAGFGDFSEVVKNL